MIRNLLRPLFNDQRGTLVFTYPGVAIPPALPLALVMGVGSTVQATAVETDWINAPIPGNYLAGNNQELQLYASGALVNNTAGVQNMTFRIRIPTGQIVWDTGALAIPQGATNRDVELLARFFRQTAGLMLIAARLRIGPLNSFIPGGLAVTPAAAAFDVEGVTSTAVVDSTQAQILRVTIQPGINDNNLFSTGPYYRLNKYL